MRERERRQIEIETLEWAIFRDADLLCKTRNAGPREDQIRLIVALHELTSRYLQLAPAPPQPNMMVGHRQTIPGQNIPDAEFEILAGLLGQPSVSGTSATDGSVR